MKKEALELILKIVIVVGTVFVLFRFVFGVCRMSDDSMSPSLKNGDLAFFYRMQKEYLPSDVVILEKDGEIQARRIIAKSGDVVDIQKDGLLVNGYFQQELMIYTDTLPYKDGITFPITIGKDEYFVLADHRNQTKDSRIYGTVKKKEIKGVVMTLLRRRNF